MDSMSAEVHVINGHDWMRQLRFPLSTVASLRDMRVNEELTMFEFFGPPLSEGMGPTIARASFEKLRGRWRLSVMWMLHVGKVKKRGHIWSWVDFVLEPGNQVRFLPEVAKSGGQGTGADELSCRRICRLVARLGRMAKNAGDSKSSLEMTPYPAKAGKDDVPIVEYLATIAAPPLRTQSTQISV